MKSSRANICCIITIAYLLRVKKRTILSRWRHQHVLLRFQLLHLSLSLPACWHVWNWQWPNSWKICHLLTWMNWSEWLCSGASYKAQCGALNLKQYSFSLSLFLSLSLSDRNTKACSGNPQIWGNFFFFSPSSLNRCKWILANFLELNPSLKTQDIYLNPPRKYNGVVWWGCNCASGMGLFK